MSWCRQIRLVLDINECSLKEVIDEESSSNVAISKKKSMKALGICLTYMSQEVINETIDQEDMSFKEVWNKLKNEYGGCC